MQNRVARLVSSAYPAGTEFANFNGSYATEQTPAGIRFAVNEAAILASPDNSALIGAYSTGVKTALERACGSLLGSGSSSMGATVELSAGAGLVRVTDLPVVCAIQGPPYTAGESSITVTDAAVVVSASDGFAGLSLPMGSANLPTVVTEYFGLEQRKALYRYRDGVTWRVAVGDAGGFREFVVEERGELAFRCVPL